ncbi:hypothetical protein FRC01_003602 [Tulasnella sp. 417]|nr:hypothetical protein FRC01_003602 [Tulasnella sp. 417]
MRIRIASHPPLPALKAWFGIDDHTAATQTILDVKRGLSEQLSVLSQHPLQHLLLELEGFELLDESLCSHVLREGDLINIKQSSLAQPSKKRKSATTSLEPAEDDRSNKRAKLTLKPPEDTDESSSSSSSDRSESSSETDTESSSSESSDSSESTTSSESDSSTSGSSSDVPSVARTFPQTSAGNRTSSSLVSGKLTPLSKHFVPPGQGKASTRDRNRRRRLARKYRSTSAHGLPAVPIHTQNAPSLGRPDTPNTFTFTAPLPAPLAQPVPIQMPQEPLMMMSLKNSNKRKGYKERLTGSSGPTKLVFRDPHESRPPDVPLESDAQGLSPPASRTSRRPKVSRLIPPSETADLPANIFVTSIDVEADLWEQSPGSKRAKKAVSNREKANSTRSDHGRTGNKEISGYAVQCEEDVSLNYGDPEDAGIHKQIPHPQPPKVDWDAIESEFRSFPQIDVATLSAGAVIVWQVGSYTLPQRLSAELTFPTQGSWDRLLNSNTGNALLSGGSCLSLGGSYRG